MRSVLLFTGIVFLVSAAVMVLVVRAEIQSHALSQARTQADMLISRNLAIHSYFNEELKPELFNLDQDYFDQDSFMPSWMSSTYAVRRITTRAYEMPGAYYYKEAAINARSPENEADGYERTFLSALNRGDGASEVSGVREVDGEQVFFLLRRGEVMHEECLRCHSTPDRAPAELVAHFGPERSFGRQDGEVVSALSVQIPIEIAYSHADEVARDISLAMLGLLAVVTVAFYLFVDRRIVAPLDAVREASVQISVGDRPLHAGVPVAGGREMQELGIAFNTLARSLEDQLEELEEAHDELSKANRAKDRFLGNLSHELRTPLNSIIGFSGVLGAELAGPLTAEQKRQLEMISRSGNHLLGLIQDLLDYAKGQSGTLEVELSTFSPEDAVTRVVEILHAEAERKGIALEMDGVVTRSEMYSDRLKLEQILLNIVGNAVKHTERGPVRVAVESAGDHLVVRVADTGPGIPPDAIEHLFDEFYQAPAPNLSKPQGTGLGLSISLSYARLLGGDVSVTSEVGRGSEFTLALPLHYVED